jgi:hypothetical protein
MNEKPKTKNTEIPFCSHTKNVHDIDGHVDEPEEEERRKNQSWELRLNPCALRITGTDSDALKWTQERGGADGKTPGNSGYLPDCHTTNIIQICSIAKDDMMSSINVEMTGKILTMVRCMKMGSMGFFT